MLTETARSSDMFLHWDGLICIIDIPVLITQYIHNRDRFLIPINFKGFKFMRFFPVLPMYSAYGNRGLGIWGKNA